MSQREQSLEWAKTQIISDDTAGSLDEALTILADASANGRLRGGLQDSALFDGLLVVFATNYLNVSWENRPPPKNLLRCIGNLVADNDDNRAALSNSVECMSGLKSSLFNYTPDQENSELEDFAIKILFNLCNEFPQAQQQAFKSGLHVALVKYITLRRWNAADEPLLSISTDLLARMIEHKNDIKAKENYDLMKWMVCSLYLVLTQDLDSAMFLDVLGVICTYLQIDENFVLAAIQEKQMKFICDSLLLGEKMRRARNQRHSDAALEDSEDEDEDDEKLYQQCINILVQALADASSTPAFTTLYAPDDPLINSLCTLSVPPNDHSKYPTSIPSTACLILGNLATNDSNCLALASPSKIQIAKLFRHLGSSSDTSFLNAAAGLLRHLAIPAANRANIFNDPAYLTYSAHLYTAITLEQVQIAGLQLTRQLLSQQPSQVESLLSSPENGDKTAASLSTILALFASTTSTATKLEITRLITTCLRTLQPSSTPASTSTSSFSNNSDDSQSLQNLLSYPLLPPLLFAITKAPEAGILAVQAEAWLGLNLLLRVPGSTSGASAILSALGPSDEGEESGFLKALESRVRGEQPQVSTSSSSAPGSGDQARITELADDVAQGDDIGDQARVLSTQQRLSEEEGAEENGEKDTRPDWVKRNERENAVLLVHDLLGSGEVGDEGLKGRLEALLKEGMEGL